MIWMKKQGHHIITTRGEDFARCPSVPLGLHAILRGQANIGESNRLASM